MAMIELTQGHITQIDDCMYEYLSQWKWTFDNGYAIRSSVKDGKPIKIHMHRVIINCSEGMVCDHIDGNKLNNKRENLREVSQQQNLLNRSKRNTECSSRYKGVSWNKQRQKYSAYIYINGSRKFLGYFSDENLAAEEYNKNAIEMHGVYAKLNIIEY
jgi:hypothetical protein